MKVQLVDDSRTRELELGVIDTLPDDFDATGVDEMKLMWLFELGLQEYPVPLPLQCPVPVPQ